MTTTTAPAAIPPELTDRAPRGGPVPFFLLTFAVSWLAWWTAVALGGSTADLAVQVLFLLGGTGPTIAALVLGLAGRRSPRTASARRTAVWLPAALGLGALPAVVAAFLPSLLGTTATGAGAVVGAVAAAGGPLVFVASTLLLGPLSEEFGWRGHAQPRLRRRLSPLSTSLVLGGVWGTWHLPLFFLPGTWQESVGLASPEGAMIVLGALPLSALAWFVSERLRGGVPAAVVLHATSNASLALFPPTSGTAAALFVGTLLLLAVLVLARGRSTGRLGV